MRQYDFMRQNIERIFSSALQERDDAKRLFISLLRVIFNHPCIIFRIPPAFGNPFERSSSVARIVNCASRAPENAGHADLYLE